MHFSTIRSVLVATDLTPESDSVVQAAAVLARQVGAQLHVVHAVNIQGRAVSSVPLDLLLLERLVDDARAGVRAQMTRVLPPGMAISTVSIDYKAAAPAILEKARAVEADLIVMGPHASRIPFGHWAGTTAEKVVEKAAVPCLVVKRPLAAPPRRVLLPLGSYDIRVGALEPLVRWMCGLHETERRIRMVAAPTEVWALHVVDAPRRWHEISELFSAALSGVESELPIQVRRMLSWGEDPATDIVREAEAGEVDLVVLGVRGHGALMRFLVRSVSSAVLRRTDRSVLLFPPRLYERWARGSRLERADTTDVIPLRRSPRGESHGPSRGTRSRPWPETASPNGDDFQDPPDPLPVA